MIQPFAKSDAHPASSRNDHAAVFNEASVSAAAQARQQPIAFVSTLPGNGSDDEASLVGDVDLGRFTFLFGNNMF